MNGRLKIGGGGLLLLAALWMAWPESAEAYPVQDSGAFALPLDGQTHDLYDDALDHLGVTVRVSAGSAQVESVTAQGATVLGTVAAGQACVFEGEFTHLRVRAVGPDVTGTYESRAVTGALDPDAIVGAGTVTLTAGTPVCIYKKVGAAAHRTIGISPVSGSCRLRTSSTGADIFEVDAGDDGSPSLSVTECWLEGSGDVLFDAKDSDAPEPAEEPTDEGSASGNAGDEDDVHIDDGSVCWRIDISNTGEGKVEIQYKHKDQAAKKTEVDPDDDISLSCHLLFVKVGYTANGGKVTYTKKKVE